jgi:hypothetical protein
MVDKEVMHVRAGSMKTGAKRKWWAAFAVLWSTLVWATPSFAADARPVKPTVMLDEIGSASEPPGSADPVRGWWYLQNYGTNLCLSSNYSGAVYTTGCRSDVPAHRWLMTNDSFGFTTKIINVATGRCLSSNSNGAVYTTPCRDDVPHHVWKPPGPNEATIVFNVGADRCLSSNYSGNVYTVDHDYCGDVRYHHWWRF